YSDYKTKLSNFINLVPHKDYLFKNIFQFPTLKQICNIYDNFDIDIRSLNNQFVKNELSNYNTFFNEVLHYPLDNQQIDAIVKDEDNTLVIAGAGCGKTSTVQGKINYILEKNLALPHEIQLCHFLKIVLMI